MNHITDVAKRTWLQERMEPVLNAPPIDRDTQLYILEKVAAAEVLENFIHTKYVGTKRFSLEGGESLIPLLELVVERARPARRRRGRARHGAPRAAQRARQRHGQVAGATCSPSSRTSSPESMFGGGDVKYHLGFSTDRVDPHRRRRCTCRWRSTRATSRRSIRSSSGACAPSSAAARTSDARARARRAGARRRRVRRPGPGARES